MLIKKSEIKLKQILSKKEERKIKQEDQIQSKIELEESKLDELKEKLNEVMSYIQKMEKSHSDDEDEYKQTKYKIDLDEAIFGKASMEKVARHRMREIKMWSKLKKEFNDGSFNDKDVNQHQLESYGLQYHEKEKRKI